MRRRTLVAAPILLGLVLAFPTLRWPFLWDDFDFLGRAATLSPRDLLPSTEVVFYRPLSREVYFWLLYHLGGASPLVAHLASAAIFGSIVFLLLSLVRRLAGTRASIISGLTLACSAALPIALGWISVAQDLLSAAFVLLALNLQLSRKSLAAAAAMMGALLSKETALAFVPIPILIAYLAEKERPQGAIRAGAAQGLVVAAWAAIHPWIRTMGSHSNQPSAGGDEYIALHRSGVLRSVAEGLRLTLNLPGGGVVEFPKHILPWAILATLLILGLAVLARTFSSKEDPPPVERGRTILAVAGAWILMGGILLTSLVVHRWFSYYALLPGLGLSMLAGLALREVRSQAVAVALIAFLWFGIALRGSHLDPEIPTELNFKEAALALDQVEHGFKALHQQLPPAANVFVSVQTRGHSGLYRHLFRAQPLRIWYRQPGIWVLDPNRRRAGGGTDFLFWIDPDLEVFEINPVTLEPRGPKAQINLAHYQKTLRGYAFGLASGGQTDFAVRILTTMYEPSRELSVFDRRTAAAILIAAGRGADADRLLAGVPAFDVGQSTQAVTALLIEPIAGLDLDAPAMRAFGLDTSDVETLRSLMHALAAGHGIAGQLRIARRIQALDPGDAEVTALLLREEQSPHPREIVPAVPHDVPQ
jgi:hypothetical protein